MTKRIAVCTALMMMVLAAFPAWADSATINPIDDAYVLSKKPDINANGGSFSIGATAVSGYMRAFLKFDLTSYASIDSASLWLYNFYGATGNPVSINAYSASNSWNETNLTYNNQPAYSGLPATATLGAAGGWYSLDVSSLAQAAAGNPLSLAMLGLGNQQNFYSDEYTNAAYRPYLNVTGTVSSAPGLQPSFVLLLGTGFVRLAATRLRKTGQSKVLG